MLLKRTNIKLKETKKYLHCWGHSKKAAKSWLLNSKEKLIQTALRRTACSASKNPKEKTIQKILILYKRAKYMQSKFN